MEKILQHNILLSGEPDVPFRNLTTSSTYQLVRQKKSIIRSRSFIWSSRIPIKYSILLWKMLNGLLPFGDNLEELCFHWASKCCFCNSSDSIDHFFLDCMLTSHT
ncbi:hypothetical protein ACH5RR_039266 [Cinchona calisaya]|uniref:Reverse transcriptase zinc-binding domain-containing protein n=1 Tax=Cinchona calisaya TaxID=153742 RepID=A0ABD2XY95_9GENT